MSRSNPQKPWVLITAEANAEAESFADAVRAGLSAPAKRLPCRYFYDTEGSELFEAICRLPEYYIPRAEREILAAHAADIVALFSEPFTLVELGSGNAAKTRVLIEEALRRLGRLRYVPVDISRVMLEDTCRALTREYHSLEIMAIAGEYEPGIARLQSLKDRRRLILWLGSNIGNFDRAEAVAFMRLVAAGMAPGDRLLAGIDLRKDPAVLERAYNDAAGITARFNLNLLARVNRELGGHFDLRCFHHRAVYDDTIGRIEMYLVSNRDQRVRIDSLDLEISFRAGEAIHTEDSYKYSPEEIDALAGASGLSVERQWSDSRRRFSTTVFLLRT